MKTIFLCGFMGCGKSTAGRILAEKLDTEFLDMDAYIVEREGMSITQIFSEKGEDYFRRTETNAVRELAEKGGVIACGGGAMLKSENAAIARTAGTAVYIDVPFEMCYDRISGDRNRPIVMNNTKEELEFIYESRVPVYKKNSDMTITGSGTPEEIAERILAAVDTP